MYSSSVSPSKLSRTHSSMHMQTKRSTYSSSIQNVISTLVLQLMSLLCADPCFQAARLDSLLTSYFSKTVHSFCKLILCADFQNSLMATVKSWPPLPLVPEVFSSLASGEIGQRPSRERKASGTQGRFVNGHEKILKNLCMKRVYRRNTDCLRYTQSQKKQKIC